MNTGSLSVRLGALCLLATGLQLAVNGNSAEHYLTTLPVAAPEIFPPEDKWYMAALPPARKEIQSPRIEWVRSVSAPEKRRVIIETDAGGDPDDEQSLVRFLLYANEWDIEGIIANRPTARPGENLNPVHTGLGIVQQHLSAYGEVHHRLQAHAPGFPTKEYLWDRTVPGYSTSDAGVKLSAAGSTDPDRHALTYRWVVYPEAGTYSKEVHISEVDSAETSVLVPADAGAKDIHVLLTVRDHGEPPLASYRRAVIKVDATQHDFAAARTVAAKVEPAWRSLALITEAKVDNGWCHVGWGGFAVDDGTLRTECDPKGLGLLVYRRERFGNCQIRVVFKSKDAKCNAGVFVRIDNGILAQVNQPGAAFDRDEKGKISGDSGKRMMASGEREEGPWFAVHRGYEVQIMDANDKFHRTGAIYSLAASSAVSQKAPGEWKTMVITLAGNRILVDLEGQRITRFDPASADVPRNRQWFEPKREPQRPEMGYLGQQNHDPGDIVWFKEISVRPLTGATD